MQFNPGCSAATHSVCTTANRAPTDAKNTNDTPARVILQDFSIFDYNQDGISDLAAVTSNRILVGVKGDPASPGNGIQISGNGADQSGNNFGPSTNGAGGFDAITGQFLRIRTGDFDGGAGITTLDDADGAGIRILTSTFHPGPQTATTGLTLDAGPGLVFQNGEGSLAPHAPFDYHYQSTFDPTTEDPGTSDDNLVHGLIFVSSPYLSYSRLGLELHAGDGGNSLLGAGGVGGSLGSGKITVAPNTPPSTGSGADSGVDPAITGILNLTLAGQTVLRAGHGGDGFTAGGHGGGIFGVNLQDRITVAAGAGVTTEVALSLIATAGAGGRGVSFTGGFGGSIGYNSFDTSDTSTTLTAGSGGDGVLGGGGGSIIGNGTTRFDTLSNFSSAIAGSGGNGTLGGGAGGTIINFHSTVPENSGTGASGNLFFQAGTGGSSVSGPGGSGGSITNSSPVSLGTINGSVSYLAGDAGSGRSGGTGGSVSQLTITTVAPSQPSQLTIHGGLGGNGTGGNGGLGGSLISIDVPSKGTQGLFNSVLAGDGGNSGGAAGGAGGSIVSLHSSTTDNSFAVAAGAGGSGLYRGGAGGSVLNTLLDFGASTNKALVIAGAGGDAHAFIPNRLNGGTPTPGESFRAYGGRPGVGGQGGSIIGFTQTGSNLSHADLIAGNGGSTLNFGTFFDKVSFVGNGGSVENVTVSGTIGNIDSHVPIRSYNDLQSGQTVADFVNEVLRNPAVPIPLNDALGNVGIVVGAAGSNKQEVLNPGTKPLVTSSVTSRFATNGSLINVTANGLMSAVAGNVDFIAGIQVVQALNVPDSVLAHDVDKEPTGQQNYIDSTGQASSNPSLGGALVDGIIAAKRFLDGNGNLQKPTYPKVQLG